MILRFQLMKDGTNISWFYKKVSNFFFFPKKGDFVSKNPLQEAKER